MLETNKIYLGDCLEVMKDIEKYFDIDNKRLQEETSGLFQIQTFFLFCQS